MHLEITKSRILIVEGKEDKMFFEALVKNMKLENIQIMDIGGKTFLRPNLKALILTPKFDTVTSLGIARDADDNFEDAFKSVCSALSDAKLPVPTKPLVPKANGERL